MDRRVFINLSASPLFALRHASRRSQAELALPDYDWIADIKSGTDYKLLKTIPRADLMFLSPPEERGGNLRLDSIEWESFDGQGDSLLIPVGRANPEWHVLGSARYSVSLWLGPNSLGQPSALLEFDPPTPIAVYVHYERIQQIILLAESV